jgi:hypothetical protein
MVGARSWQGVPRKAAALLQRTRRERCADHSATPQMDEDVLFYLRVRFASHWHSQK